MFSQLPIFFRHDIGGELGIHTPDQKISKLFNKSRRKLSDKYQSL